MANKSIQMKDGSNNLYPVSSVLENISSHFVFQPSSGNGFATVFLDKVNKIVRGHLFAYNIPPVNNSTPIYMIDAGYRPVSGNWGFPAVIMINDKTYTYNGVIRTDGKVVQSLSSQAQATGIYMSFEYKLT